MSVLFPPDSMRPRGSGPIGLMSVKEVAAYLALSDTRVALLIRDNLIPAFDIGRGKYRQWRVAARDLETWLHARRSGVIPRRPPRRPPRSPEPHQRPESPGP